MQTDTATKTYAVDIRATVTKTLYVTAASAEEAVEMAHQDFDFGCDDLERYEQDTVGVYTYRDSTDA
jgi:hypothetical protein